MQLLRLGLEGLNVLGREEDFKQLQLEIIALRLVLQCRANDVFGLLMATVGQIDVGLGNGIHLGGIGLDAAHVAYLAHGEIADHGAFTLGARRHLAAGGLGGIVTDVEDALLEAFLHLAATHHDPAHDGQHQCADTAIHHQGVLQQARLGRRGRRSDRCGSGSGCLDRFLGRRGGFAHGRFLGLGDLGLGFGLLGHLADRRLFRDRGLLASGGRLGLAGKLLLQGQHLVILERDEALHGGQLFFHLRQTGFEFLRLLTIGVQGLGSQHQILAQAFDLGIAGSGTGALAARGHQFQARLTDGTSGTANSGSSGRLCARSGGHLTQGTTTLAGLPFGALTFDLGIGLGRGNGRDGGRILDAQHVTRLQLVDVAIVEGLGVVSHQGQHHLIDRH